jgi:hypothetical protein
MRLVLPLATLALLAAPVCAQTAPRTTCRVIALAWMNASPRPIPPTMGN